MTLKGNAPPENVKIGTRYYQGKGAVIEPGPHAFEYCFPWIFDAIEVTTDAGATLRPAVALQRCRGLFEKAHKQGGRVWIVGNGGSAAIASHLAVDFTKNGGIRAMAFNDAPTLTCLANDFGYAAVFAKQIECQARSIDVVVIISTSGKSPNILAAADAAAVLECSIITLSGMNPNNVLRGKGNINFYVPCASYGIVEASHLILMHSIVDA